MVGDIAAPRVIIVEGAAFRGHVDMGAVAEPKLGENRPAPRAVTAPSRPVSRPMTPPKPPPPPSPRSESKPPPPPPPPLPPKPAVAAAHEALEASGPVPVALGKKKVVVKRRK
jgi:hypothetical protein